MITPKDILDYIVKHPTYALKYVCVGMASGYLVHILSTM